MISDEHLEILLDRSPSTFEARKVGWNADQQGSRAAHGSAFEVTDMLESMDKEQDDIDYNPQHIANAIGETELDSPDTSNHVI